MSNIDQPRDFAALKRAADLARANPPPQAELGEVAPAGLADRAINTLDTATVHVVGRIDNLIDRLGDIRTALTDDNKGVQKRIRANIELAARAELITKTIETEFASILSDRKRTIEGDAS